MKRVNLDAEFEIFKEKFCELHGLEEEWQRHQREEGLIDMSNGCDHSLGDKSFLENEGLCTYCNTKWSVIFDAGKPYEQTYATDAALEQGLKEFYMNNKDSDYPYNALVYNANGDDFTESQFVVEMVGNIMGEEEERLKEAK